MATATRPPIPPALKGRVLNAEPISAEEYLEQERAETEERHEFIDGWVIQVSGASLEHNIIVSNLSRTLGTQLRETDCRAITNDLRVALPSVDKYAYPDVVVYCGEPEIEENHLDMLYNPKVVIETMSPSTVDYDRGEKFARYRQLDSLREYLLVAQDRPHVEHYSRQDDGSWRFIETDDLDTEITCLSLDVTLPLTEVYLDVSFDSDESD
ncbi:MAG: Uma2 family endonuclease [Salinibacter sp.]